MDLSAEFDTVDHDILLTILHNHFSITNNALSWFNTYLFPRQFYVNVDGQKSSNKPLNFSAPQGHCGEAYSVHGILQHTPVCNPPGQQD